MAKNDYKIESRIKATRDKQVFAERKKELRQGYYTLGVVGRIFSFAIIMLLMVGLYRISIGYTVPTFTDLLQLLENAPNLQIPSLSSVLQNFLSTDWGLLNFLKSLISINVGLLDISIWLINSILSVVQFLFYFVRWIFVF